MLRHTDNYTITAGVLTHSIRTGPCLYRGVLLGLDQLNDVVLTIYHNTAGSGDMVLPTNRFKSTQYGLNGVVLHEPIYCRNGLYLVGSWPVVAGTAIVYPLWEPWL